HRRDVKRVLERLAVRDQSVEAFIVVSRRVRWEAATHLYRERRIQHWSARADSLSECGSVDEWLERRTGLPEPLRSHVKSSILRIIGINISQERHNGPSMIVDHDDRRIRHIMRFCQGRDM